MPGFGNKSLTQLRTCHSDLQRIAIETIKYIDFSILEGHRPPTKQMEYYKKGRELRDGQWIVVDRKAIITHIDGVSSKGYHNHDPSMAFDIAPYPIDFNNKPKATARFYHLAGYILLMATKLYADGEIKYKVKWGGDWDSDKDFSDQKFDDLPHFELKDET